MKTIGKCIYGKLPSGLMFMVGYRWMADSSCTISGDNNSPPYSPDDDCISEHKSSNGTYKLRDSR